MREVQGNQTIRIDAAGIGQRLDVFLTAELNDISRRHIQASLAAGLIDVNAQPKAKASYRLKLGEVVTIRGIMEPVPEQLMASPTGLVIIYEDANILVIDKPSGLIVHPKPGSAEPSVAGSVEALVDDADMIRPGIVHRLDRDTSGVMVIAKHSAAKQHLQAAFKARTVQKTYWALVHGRTGLGVQRLSFGLNRSAKNPTRMEVDPLGKPSETLIRSLAYGKLVSLVEAQPTTGRTHQIRVHLSALRHPIVGDRLYGLSSDISLRHRLMLHAYSLRLPLLDGSLRTFMARPGDDFENVLLEFDCDYEVGE